MEAPPTATRAVPTLPPSQRDRSRRSSLLTEALLGVALTAAGISLLVLFHAAIGGHEEHEPPLLVHMVRDGALALPGTTAAVLIALWMTRRWYRRHGGEPGHQRAITAVVAALAAAAALAVGGPVHERLFGAHEVVELALPLDMGRDALVALVVLIPVAWFLTPRAAGGIAPPPSLPAIERPWGQTLAGVWLLVAALTAVGLLASAVAAGALAG